MYLAVGHIACDRTPSGMRLGGTVTYSSLTAQSLQAAPHILTSAPPDLDLHALAPLPIHRITSDHCTTFENRGTPEGRSQRVYARARDITVADLPAGWPPPTILHLGPIIGEVSLGFVKCFPDALTLATPQGWMRSINDQGKVSYKRWQPPQGIDVLIFSIEDTVHDEAEALRLAQSAPLSVVTRDAAGASLYVEGQHHHVDPHPAQETDATGAGDVFAAAFVVRLQQTGDPLLAARFAAVLAADSVRRAGLASTTFDPAALEAAYQFT